MIIAAHIVLAKDSASNYLFTLLCKLAQKHPAYVIHFFMPETEMPLPALSSNIQIHFLHTRYQKNGWIGFWYRYRLPGLLKKTEAQIFISDIGRVSVNANIKQYIFLHAARPGVPNPLRYTQYPYQQKRNFLLNTRYASAILSTHPANRKLFITAQNNKKMLDCLPGLPEAYRPFGWEENQKTLAAFSKEEGYFLYVVTENTQPAMLKMLKAFSIFKKWQKSSMKLLFLLYQVSEREWVPNFDLYKYKNEVIFQPFTTHEEAAKIFSAAYLQVYYPQEYADENFDVMSLQCAVPLIVPERTYLSDKLLQAACYTADSAQALADRMILLYKDENLKNGLLTKREEVLKKYHWPLSLEVLEELLR